MQSKLPTWVNIGLIPLINLSLAFFFSGVVVVILGENPVRAMQLLVYGAFGYEQAIGYTLYYATNFIFAGLAVAVAFHCGLFNIGGEGQAYIGGLGIGLACLWFGHLPFIMVLPLAIVAGVIFGGIWGFIPGWLQARRGSHTVITTIMLNFIASAIMTYLMVNVLIKPGQQIPESDRFAESARMPRMQDILEMFGIEAARSPLNASLIIALICCVLVWIFIWKSRAGYELRVVGLNERSAVYGGISPGNQMIIAMTIGGALAGLIGLNVLMGSAHRMILDFTGGVGFVGIAVALMGRNHPFGVILAAVLFGALYQGGSELSFDMPKINRDMVVVIQGLVILFAGALEHMFRPRLERLFARSEFQERPA